MGHNECQKHKRWRKVWIQILDGVFYKPVISGNTFLYLYDQNWHAKVAVPWHMVASSNYHSLGS